MRSFSELEGMEAGKWTEEEVFAHLSATFEEACARFPNILEPYSILLADADSRGAKIEIMRRGLRETIPRRHPLATDAVSTESHMRRAERLGREIDRVAEYIQQQDSPDPATPQAQAVG